MKRLAILILVAAALAAVSAGAVLAVKQPKVATDPANVNFGSAAIGVGAGWSVSVTNNTKRSITYQAASDDGPFSFDPVGCVGATLAPGASCVAAIDFRPTAVGTVSGVVSSLWTSGNRTLSSDVSVSGTGYVLELP
jgi:hypothetical protein